MAPCAPPRDVTCQQRVKAGLTRAGAGQLQMGVVVVGEGRTEVPSVEGEGEVWVCRLEVCWEQPVGRQGLKGGREEGEEEEGVETAYHW